MHGTEDGIFEDDSDWNDGELELSIFILMCQWKKSILISCSKIFILIWIMNEDS